MKKNKIETIIVGAGIAGIACARHLAKHNKKFRVITKNIGGRIMTGTDGHINYGAYFVLDNYHHVLPLVKKGEKLHPFFVEFHDRKKHGYHLIKMWQHPLQTARLLWMLYTFKAQYESFKKLCETTSQKKTIGNNPVIKKLYFQSATAFIKEKKITDIAEKFLSEGIYMCTFLPLSKISAFDFMRLCLGLIIPAYEFTFLQDEAVKKFANKINIDTVVKISKKGKKWKVETKNGDRYKARNVIIATEPAVAQKLIGIKKIKMGSNTYVFHIAGTLKKKWQKGQFELFNSTCPVIFIRKQNDGSYIFYTKTAKPDLKKYFVKSKIIFKKEWKPAFNIKGETILGCTQGKRLYLIGDHNIIGLEDAYISGLYAANKITESDKSKNCH